MARCKYFFIFIVLWGPHENLINSTTGGLNMDSYKMGDAVKLKSGGAIMMIHAKRKDEHFECVWHDGATPHSKIYSSKVLMLAKAD